MEHEEDVLFQAILDKDIKVVAECILGGKTALSKNSCGDMALHFACLNSNIEALRLLKDTLQAGDIDTINIEEDESICGTALHMSMDGQVDEQVVKLLLEWGANPNAIDAKGSTVLHELIYRAWEDFQDDFQSEESMWEDEDEVDIESVCSDHENSNDSDLVLDDPKGQSYFRKFSMLVQFGADVNLQHTGTSMTPFHFWCQNMHWNTESKLESAIPNWCFYFLQLLLDCGVDSSVLDERGETALHYLAQRHFKPQHVLFMNSYKDLVSKVLQHLKGVDHKNMYGRTLLHCAVEHSNAVFVELLLNYSLDVNAQDKFGLTSNHLISHSIKFDETAFVEGILYALISKQADINIQDTHGLTPLHHAVQLNNRTATRVLLSEGANKYLKDNDGRTVVDVAYILNNEASIELLGWTDVTEKLDVTDQPIHANKPESENQANTSIIFEVLANSTFSYDEMKTKPDNKNHTSSIPNMEVGFSTGRKLIDNHTEFGDQTITTTRLTTQMDISADKSSPDNDTELTHISSNTHRASIFTTDESGKPNTEVEVHVSADGPLSDYTIGTTPDNKLHELSTLKTELSADELLPDNELVSIRDNTLHKPNTLKPALTADASLSGHETEPTPFNKIHKANNDVQQCESIPNKQITSDISRGWYFPLCCHKQYSTENAWSEHIERVPETSVDQWLKEYPMCEHNRRVVLQNAVSALETNTKQVLLDMADEHSMRKEIYELAVKVSNNVAILNPLFESRVLFGGSVSEGTKIGACDEFDLVFDLWKLRQYADIVKPGSDQLKGFVKLKIVNADEIVKHEMSHLIDEEGFLNRVNTSIEFHKYLERAFRMENVWHNTNYFSFWGTTNSFGECSNIGQLKLVWYGPWCVRQDVSVDIAPIIKVGGWYPEILQSNIRIIDQEVVKAVGCYLMMKDASRYIGERNEGEEDGTSGMENDSSGQSTETTLFKISISQVEHATMHYLPSVIKMGYKIAKSIQLQCPAVLFLITDIFMDSLPCGKIEIDTDTGDQLEQIRGIMYVGEYLTSYVLKTGLFHELHRRGIQVPFEETDTHNDHWNSRVIDEPAFRPGAVTKSDVSAAVDWAAGIYKRLLDQVQQRTKVSEYFLPAMDATKVSAESGSFAKITGTFLKIMIHLLENFEIPEDIALVSSEQNDIDPNRDECS